MTNESGWWDLNPRPLAPEASALPSCATARDSKFYRLFKRIAQLTHRRLFPNEALYQAEPQPATASGCEQQYQDVCESQGGRRDGIEPVAQANRNPA